jgi:hypothetical protein
VLAGVQYQARLRNNEIKLGGIAGVSPLTMSKTNNEAAMK